MDLESEEGQKEATTIIAENSGLMSPDTTEPKNREQDVVHELVDPISDLTESGGNDHKDEQSIDPITSAQVHPKHIEDAEKDEHIYRFSDLQIDEPVSAALSEPQSLEEAEKDIPPRILRDSITDCFVDLGEPPPFSDGLFEVEYQTMPVVTQLSPKEPVPKAPKESVTAPNPFSLMWAPSLLEISNLKLRLGEVGPEQTLPMDEVLACALRACGNDTEVAAATIIGLTASANTLNKKLPEFGQEDLLAEWLEATSDQAQQIDKQVSVDSNEIGITVENVLERTIVHLVKDGSAAHTLGVPAGALLLAIHDQPTHTLSHFETVDALKRAPRPARLRFRPLTPPLLKCMRDQMHELVAQTAVHNFLAKHLPLQREEPAVGAARGAMRFAAPPQAPPDTLPDSSSHFSIIVSDWASEQLRLMLLMYISLSTFNSSCNSFASEISSLGSRKQHQLQIVTRVLDIFNESTRQLSQTSTSIGVRTIPHLSRLSTLTEMINILVFGLPLTDEETEPHRIPKNQLVDWCSADMHPLLIPMMDVMCALLEADCAIPLLFPPNFHNGEASEGWVSYDVAAEPALNDGAPSALLIMVVRAYSLVSGDQSATKLCAPLVASLASTRSERARVASCRLALEIYPRASKSIPEKFIIRGVATRLLLQSQEASVRASAVTAIQRLSKVVLVEDLDWLLLLVEAASADGDTIVRRGSFEFALRILHRLPEIFNGVAITFDGGAEGDIDLHLLRCRLVAVVQRLVEDPVASVRHAVAAHCASLCTLLGGGRLGEQWSTWVVNTLHTFLRDDDGAVRTAAIDAVPFVVTLLRGFAHRYVFHAIFDNEASRLGWRGAGGSIGGRDSRSAVPWSEVESLIAECCALPDPSDTVIHMAVTAVKKSAGMLLPSLLKLSRDAPEEMRCKVAAVAGRLLLQVSDEFRHLRLWGWGHADRGPRGDPRHAAWRCLRHELTQDLLGPLLLSLIEDGHRVVLTTLFTEMTALPTTFLINEPEGGVGVAIRNQQQYVAANSDANLRGPGSMKHRATVEIFSEALLTSLSMALEEISKHRDWRCRAVCARGAAAFAPFATTSALQDRLAQMTFSLMRDKVNSVRLAAAEALCLTALIRHGKDDSIGNEDLPSWSEAIVIPQLYSLMQRQIARDRQLAVHMIQFLVSLDAVALDVTIGVLLPLLLNASQDAVPNVRLTVAKTLAFFVSMKPVSAEHAATFESKGLTQTEGGLLATLSSHSELARSLERLCEDEDNDVSTHAKNAMWKLEALIQSSSAKSTTSVR